ncbi:MAG: hypothetical protein R3F59_28105 [Myxococcota bacterium]
MFAWLEAQGAPAALLAPVRARWATHLRPDAADAQGWIRPLCEALAPLAQAACLVAERQTDPVHEATVRALLAAAARPPVDDPEAFDRDRALSLG